MSLTIKLNELVPAKEAARSLPKVLARLNDPAVTQLVLTSRNKPRAIIVEVARHEELVAAAARGQR